MSCDGPSSSTWHERPNAFLHLMLSRLWQKIWTGSFYHPSAWWKGRCLCHFGKMLHAAAIEVGTEGLPEQWLHLHIVKRETGRKSRESFLPEPTLGWDSLCPLPDISDFRSSPCEKKAQILPELLDSFQPIIATPCIQIGTSKSLVLKSCRRTGL